MAEKKTPTSKSSTKKATPKKNAAPKSKNTKNTTGKTAKQSNSKLAQFKQKTLLGLWRLFWKGSIAVFAVLAFYVLYLDAKVTKQFEGNKWQLPVQVYARTMDFHPDQYLSEKEVLWELKRLNYSEVNQLSRTGQYVIEGRTIRIYRRAFEFYDGVEQGKIFTLNFAGEKLVTIVNEAGRRIPKARLEPVQIARIGNDSKQDREFVPLDKFPTILKDALLVVEDRNFYEHHVYLSCLFLERFIPTLERVERYKAGVH